MTLDWSLLDNSCVVADMCRTPGHEYHYIIDAPHVRAAKPDHLKTGGYGSDLAVRRVTDSVIVKSIVTNLIMTTSKYVRTYIIRVHVYMRSFSSKVVEISCSVCDDQCGIWSTYVVHGTRPRLSGATCMIEGLDA